MPTTLTESDFLGFLYKVVQEHPEWARKAVNMIIEGSLEGFKTRISAEASKRAGAEVALAMAYDKLKKGTPADVKEKIEHVLANSFMFDGTPFTDALKKKKEDETPL